MSLPMDIERFNFNKIFRDIERHVEIRLKAHQSKRTQTDARFYEAFETLSQILGPLKEHQKTISEGCSRYCTILYLHYTLRFIVCFDNHLSYFKLYFNYITDTYFKILCRYDFVNVDGTVVKGNGYRSLLFLLSCLLQPVCDLVVKISKNVGSLTFSSVDAINNMCCYCRGLRV